MFADNFLYNDQYYESQIEQVLTHTVSCYKLMLSDNKPVENNENKIRNRLVKDYLTNSSIKKQLDIKGFRFSIEEGLIGDNDDEIGYTDIKVVMGNHFEDDDIFLIIECKRLDGKGSLSKNNLNGKYVNDGIMRFTTSNKYPTNLKVNSMIGFCIEAFDIYSNSTNQINQHLNSWCPNEIIKPLTHERFIKDFDHTFTSFHKTTISKQEFKLYHLMLDVTSILN